MDDPLFDRRPAALPSVDVVASKCVACAARAARLHAPALAVLVLAGACVSTTGPDDDSPPDVERVDAGAGDPFAEAFVDAHADVRAAAQPPPVPALAPLVWDASLAATAQGWADRCVFAHSSNGLGENLAVFSNEVAPVDVVDAWASEAAAYDYASNGCSGVCGHYTQLVWRDSERVGCAVADCAQVEGFGPGHLWVCNYDPPGNFVGQRPY